MAIPIEILMVEDNPGDIELTTNALATSKIINNFHVLEDGEAALDYLYQRGEYENASRPDLIFLDLNLPKLSGRDVLKDIKNNKGLMSIPVIILSSSEDAEDIRIAYELHANNFVSKPIRVQEFMKIVQAIEHFWIEIVKLPADKNLSI